MSASNCRANCFFGCELCTKCGSLQSDPVKLGYLACCRIALVVDATAHSFELRVRDLVQVDAPLESEAWAVLPSRLFLFSSKHFCVVDLHVLECTCGHLELCSMASVDVSLPWWQSFSAVSLWSFLPVRGNLLGCCDCRERQFFGTSCHAENMEVLEFSLDHFANLHW